jgi:hypothetical protein
VQILLDAERALARCGARGMEKHIWQMGHAPISAMRQVHRRLARFAQSGKSSPWLHIEG